MLPALLSVSLAMPWPQGKRYPIDEMRAPQAQDRFDDLQPASSDAYGPPPVSIKIHKIAFIKLFEINRIISF